MKSKELGTNTSPVDIHITQFGLWLCIHDEEYFLSYKDYGFFKDATINDIYEVELHHKTHLYWPSLDIDLDIEILKNPRQFPLIAKGSSLSPGRKITRPKKKIRSPVKTRNRTKSKAG
jgi:hypothetical protein